MNRYTHKNRTITVREPFFGGLCARVAILNKRDFIFRLAGRGMRLKRIGRGECMYLRRVKTGGEDFDNRFTLRANMPDIAGAVFSSALLEKIIRLSSLDFYIADDPGFAPGSSHEEDILALTYSGALDRDIAEPVVLEILKLTLDGLAATGVI